MNLKKLAVSLALSAAMILGMQTPAAAAEIVSSENMEASVETYEKQADGSLVFVGNEERRVKADGDLQKLPAPSFIKWSDEVPGTFTYDVVPEAGGYYLITMRKDDETVINLNTSSYGDGEDDWRFRINDSGTYVLEICCIGDGTTTADSDVVVSKPFVYTRPETELAKVTGLRWDTANPTVACWDEVEGNDGYCVETFMDGYRRATIHQVTRTSQDLAYLMERPGEYTFQVFARSADITKVANGRISDMSSSFSSGESADNVKNKLEEALNAGNADDALAAIKDIPQGELAAAMQTDPQALDFVRMIEQKYQDEKGITVTKNYDDTVNSMLDPGAIVVTGTALNAAEGTTDMKVNFLKEENPVDVDPVMYKNAVQMNISLDGAVDSSKLEIPMRITMPIPNGVSPSRFKVIHYHKDGSVEVITPYIDMTNNTASFTVTSFSTFVFANDTLPFSDVPAIKGNWKFESVKYVYDNGIMNGIAGTDLFKPDSQLNRAMFATVLYRMAGEPEVEFTDKFSDVEPGEYYSEAIIWANKQGIVKGFDDGSYGVNANITREQIAKMLYLYGKCQDYDVSGKSPLHSFTDKETVNSWAVEYMEWAVNAGMISGKPNEGGGFRLDPKGDATRAECAKMLMMFEKKYK